MSGYSLQETVRNILSVLKRVRKGMLQISDKKQKRESPDIRVAQHEKDEWHVKLLNATNSLKT